MTLKKLSDTLGVHPYDLVGDEELADELMHEDITDTMFYQELIHEADLRGLLLLNGETKALRDSL